MIRSEILKEIAPILRDQLVVCNIGIPSQELHAIDDQPTNFYMPVSYTHLTLPTTPYV